MSGDVAKTTEQHLQDPPPSHTVRAPMPNFYVGLSVSQGEERRVAEPGPCNYNDHNDDCQREPKQETTNKCQENTTTSFEGAIRLLTNLTT